MLRLACWFHSYREQPHNFLALLIRAHDVAKHDAAVAAAFRAGLKVGSEHPEIAAWLQATHEDKS